MIRTFTLVVASLAVGVSASAAFAQADVPLPNPAEYPDENLPFFVEQETLGKFLFWEEQMGGDNTMACGTCHIHEAGGSDPRSVDADSVHPGADGLFGTDDDVRGSKGVVSFDRVGGQFVHEDTFFPNVLVTGRKSPPSINAAYFTSIGVFWDGRATQEFTGPQSGQVELMFAGALESQAVGPPLSDVEMGGLNQTWEQIVTKLAGVKPMALATNLPPDMADFLATYPTYPLMFAAAYSGDQTITAEKIAMAIANYERTLLSDQSPLDRDLNGSEPLAAEYLPGLALFNGTANCSACHTLPFASDLSFHNIGLRPDAEDIGLEATTGSPLDRAKFKTPIVRNVAERLPLFHNGQADTIAELVDFYDAGGDFNTEGNLDANMLVLNLTEQEKADLILFLTEAVTDPRVVNNEHPFTRPTLRSELPQVNTVYGVASQNGAAELPGVLAHIPPNIGNQEFLIGVHNATANMPAALAFAWDDDPAGTPYVDPR